MSNSAGAKPLDVEIVTPPNPRPTLDASAMRSLARLALSVVLRDQAGDVEADQAEADKQTS